MTKATCSTARAASCLKTVAATLMASTTRSVSHPARHAIKSLNQAGITANKGKLAMLGQNLESFEGG